MVGFQNAATFTANTVRFGVLGLRDSAIPLNWSEISGLGLQLDGCAVGEVSGDLIRNESWFVIRLREKVKANGFFFVTSNGPEEADPVNFVLEASPDNGSTWRQVGASVWRRRVDGALDFFPHVPYATPRARSHAVVIDLGVSWPDQLLALCESFLWAICFLGMSLAGLVGLESLAPVYIILIIVLQVVFRVTAAVGYYQNNAVLAMAQTLLYIPSLFVLIIGLALFEARMILFQFLYSEMYGTAAALAGFALYRQPVGPLLLYVLQGNNTVTFAFALAMLWLRGGALSHARQLIIADKERYDKLWVTIAAGADAQQSLKVLSELVQGLCRDQLGGAPRQLLRRKPEGLSAEPEDLGVPGEVDPARPVWLLDQIFHQAACLHPVLLAKVKCWASVSEGRFPVAGAHEYMTLAEAAGDPGVKLKFAKVKTVSRAIEKLLRAYGQDVSKLVDLCRQSIVFDNVSQLVTCLRAVGDDREVVVVRIKNRLDPGYDAAASAGYRDVALNLRIVSDETKALGIETHVCELQLLLRPIAELKSEEGHKRYVEFRNLRGE